MEVSPVLADAEIEAKPATPENNEAGDEPGPSVEEQPLSEADAPAAESMDVSGKFYPNPVSRMVWIFWFLAEDGKPDDGVDDYAPDPDQLDTASEFSAEFDA